MDPKKVVENLLGNNLSEFILHSAGGNSRVYRVKTHQGDRYAVKLYPSLQHDPRDRLGTEFSAIKFLSNFSEIHIPQAIDKCDDALIGIYSWVEGKRPDADLGAIEAMLDFMSVLIQFQDSSAAKKFELASGSCLSGSNLYLQLITRLSRLEEACTNQDLKNFIENKIKPAVKKLILHENEIPIELGCLSPGDFGPHNMLMSKKSYYFIDMEYFGWDDPVKQVCDVVLHPGFELAESVNNYFLTESTELYSKRDIRFRERLYDHFTAFGLRWIFIILNEFLPEKWAIKKHTGALDLQQSQKRQLIKAKILFESLENKKIKLKKILFE